MPTLPALRGSRLAAARLGARFDQRMRCAACSPCWRCCPWPSRARRRLSAVARRAGDDLRDRGAVARSAARRGGLVSFGHAAFLGIGAYAAGILASHGHGRWSALPVALAASALFALRDRRCRLRTRGVYFIMITLAFGQMAFFVATSLCALRRRRRPHLADAHARRRHARCCKSEPASTTSASACLVGAYLLAGRLVASRFGRVLRGGAGESSAHGGDRLRALSLSARRLRDRRRCGGLAGFLLANQAEFVSPAYMHWQRSGELIFMVILGGTRHALRRDPRRARLSCCWRKGSPRLTEHWKVILGPLLVLSVLFGRGGIAGAVERWRRGELSIARLRAGVERPASAAALTPSGHGGS